MLGTTDLTPLDDDLIEQVQRTVDALYLEGRHTVASALRTRPGEVFAGINIKTTMPFADVCGEVAALSAMVGAGRRDPESIVAVRGAGWALGSFASAAGNSSRYNHPDRIKSLSPAQRQATVARAGRGMRENTMASSSIPDVFANVAVAGESPEI